MSYVIFLVRVVRHRRKNLPETPSRSGEDATYTGVVAARSGNARSDGMRFTIQGNTAGKPRRLSPRRKRGAGAKAVRGNRCSCEAPSEFVGEENVAELRALEFRLNGRQLIMRKRATRSPESA